MANKAIGSALVSHESFVAFCERQGTDSASGKSIEMLKAHFSVTGCQKLGNALTRSKTLWLNGLGLNNIEFVSNLPELERIDLSDNILSDISPLKNCLSLTHLWLSDNEIESIEVLSVLKGLKVLSIDSNRVVDIQSLSSCSKIQALNLDNNLITSLEPLKNLDELKFLFARRNRITSVRAIAFDCLDRSIREQTQESLKEVNLQCSWGVRARNLGEPGRVFQLRDLSENPLKKAPWEGGTRKNPDNCPPDATYENMRDYCRLDHD